MSMVTSTHHGFSDFSGKGVKSGKKSFANSIKNPGSTAVFCSIWGTERKDTRTEVPSQR